MKQCQLAPSPLVPPPLVRSSVLRAPKVGARCEQGSGSTRCPRITEVPPVDLPSACSNHSRGFFLSFSPRNTLLKLHTFQVCSLLWMNYENVTAALRVFCISRSETYAWKVGQSWCFIHPVGRTVTFFVCSLALVHLFARIPFIML